MLDDIRHTICWKVISTGGELQRWEAFKARRQKVGRVGKLVLILQSGQFENWFPRVADFGIMGASWRPDWEQTGNRLTVPREIINVINELSLVRSVRDSCGPILD